MSGETSRRAFLRTAAAVTVAGAVRPGFQSAYARESAVRREQAHAHGVQLRDFDYGSVELTGGPLKAQYDFIHGHYLGLDNDRLLRVYRQHAGLAAPGLDMGGWYGEGGFIPGHSLGQYISGLARLGRSTGDAACHRKVAAIVDGFAAALAANP